MAVWGSLGYPKGEWGKVVLHLSPRLEANTKPTEQALDKIMKVICLAQALSNLQLVLSSTSL